jgi:ring-1,2-phenylacetyl-CoA epoxidase subunit PaaE
MPLAKRRAAAAPHFHRLTIAEVRRETADSISIAFAIPAALQKAYRFQHGQNLTLKTAIAGEEIRRCYSICSGVDDGELRIAIKRRDGGVFSSFANDTLAAGHAIDVMTPSGNFTTALDAAAARVYVGIACGSGITPLLSIIKTGLAREPKSRFFLLYGNRTTQSIMFREALEQLKDRFLDRFSVTHVLSREAQDVAALSGRIDGGKIALLLRSVVAAASVAHAFICGPAALLDTAERTLGELGVAPQRVHVERFTVAGEPVPRRTPPTPAGAALASRTVAEAEARIDGIRHRFPVGATQTIIEAAEAAGLELPYSCRGGMCCTCRARLVEGEVAMDVNYSLERWELDAGYVLTCQSRPTTAKVVLDYDQM